MPLSPFVDGQTSTEVLSTWNQMVDGINDSNDHIADLANPHATTALQVGADPTGAAAAAVVTHVAASDPHTQYLQEAEVAATPGASKVARADAGGLLDAWISASAVAGTPSLRKLGTGATDACAGTDARLSNARTPTTHAASHASGQPDVISPASIGALASAGAETISGDKTCSGYLILANGRLRQVPDVKFGKNMTGTFVAGDRWIDAAGAMFLCTAGGTPGTWLQTQPGVATVFSGASGADITAPGNWPSSTLLNGYRVVEPGVMEWTYNSTAARWQGPLTYLSSCAAGQVAASGSGALRNPTIALPTDAYDWLLEEWGCNWNGAAGTWDVSNRWYLRLFGYNWDQSTNQQWGADITNGVVGTNGGRGLAATAILASSTFEVAIPYAVKLGAPGNLTFYGWGCRCRPVRK